MSPSRNHRSRNWQFLWVDPHSDWLDKLASVDCKYLIFVTYKDNETTIVDGYYMFEERKRPSTLGELLPDVNWISLVHSPRETVSFYRGYSDYYEFGLGPYERPHHPSAINFETLMNY